LSLFFILESWVLNLDLEILNLLSLESWSWFLRSWILILVCRLSSWFLNSLTCSRFSWDGCSLILLSFFVHHFCHHLLLSSLLSSKHLWIIVDSSWSFASTYEIIGQYTWDYIVYSLIRKAICIRAYTIYSIFECFWIIVFIQTFVCENQEWLSVKQYLGVLRFRENVRVCQKWLEEYLYNQEW